MEDALRKQISLQYLLGIHKIHDIYTERKQNIKFQREFFQLLSKKPSDFSSPNKNVSFLKEHLTEELQKIKSKQKELELLREELSMEPWNSLKDPNKLYERMVLKQDDLWSEFQKNQENPDFSYPKHEKLWGFLSENPTDINNFKEILYLYQEFLMQEHVKLDLLKQRLGEEGEKLRNEENSLERERVNRVDFEVFEDTKRKIKEELNQERQKIGLDKKKMGLLLNIVRNYLNFKADKPFDWETSIDDFIQGLFSMIEAERDVFEKDLKKKQQVKRLRDDIQRLREGNIEELNADPYENISRLLGNIGSHKESSQEEEIQRKLFKRKEEMLQHKQKELEALKKLLEKESLILQEEKVWLVNEKNKIGENTKKSNFGFCFKNIFFIKFW